MREQRNARARATLHAVDVWRRAQYARAIPAKNNDTRDTAWQLSVAKSEASGINTCTGEGSSDGF